MNAIQDFQRQLYANYKNDLSLPPTYKYIYGNPVQPVVPIDTAQDGVCIIGAYPTARFATIGSERDVPIEDIRNPFSNERYFDGSRVRSVASGTELEKAYLEPLSLRRDQCWITNLVRIFLFKNEHLEKYRRLHCVWPEKATRDQFESFAQEGLHWLQDELALARPRLVITLGAEVAGVLQNVNGQRERNALLNGDLKEFSLGSIVYSVIHLAHPGIVMRPPGENNPWPEQHKNEHLPRAKKIIEHLAG